MDTIEISRSATGLHRPHAALQAIAVSLVLLGLGIHASPAHAVDGCKVLLCLAAPSWRSIPDCVTTINELNRDLARGRPFPACSMAGAGNSAHNDWASAPSYCPPQYTRVFHTESGPIYSCDYIGAVTVILNGALYTRTWWNAGGDTVTEYTPAAKAQLGSWETRFDDDYAAWLASLAPPRSPAVGSGD